MSFMFQALLDHSQQHSPVLLFSCLKTKNPNPPLLAPLPCQLLLISLLLFAAKHLNKNFLYLTSPILFSFLSSITHHARETALVNITKSFALPVFLCLYFPIFLCGLTLKSQGGLYWPLVSARSSPYPALFFSWSVVLLHNINAFTFIAYCLIPPARM